MVHQYQTRSPGRSSSSSSSSLPLPYLSSLYPSPLAFSFCLVSSPVSPQPLPQFSSPLPLDLTPGSSPASSPPVFPTLVHPRHGPRRLSSPRADLAPSPNHGHPGAPQHPGTALAPCTLSTSFLMYLPVGFTFQWQPLLL